MSNKVFIVTGVSGSGKTTVGKALAELLKTSFYDGDSFHPASNIAKMASGIPLNDEDRLPFLKAINSSIKEKLPVETLVIACSALKEKYRELLAEGIEPSVIHWVHLQGDYDTIYHRMKQRKDHFMSADMLRSQFDAYELPKAGMLISTDKDLDQIIQQIMSGTNINTSDLGLIGLGVMGTSLARNIAGKGFSISIYNRHVAGKEEGIAVKMAETFPELFTSRPFDDIQSFVASLTSPRKIFLMVNAGRAVDDVIQHLLPFLNTGDTIVDGGNSYYKDTDRRQKQLDDHGIYFVGAGVSGGEEGALLGPSIMPGGSKKGFEAVKEILLAMAAKNEQREICCDYVGDGGAGHFVKMVHNGIEYAEMQLIAEFYSHLRWDQKKTPADIADIFEDWNKGDAGSYLLGITKDILRFTDKDGLPLIDKISDMAGSKGTGSWTTMAACELGVPVPAMAEALFSRYVSSFKSDRLRYAEIFSQSENSVIIDQQELLHSYMFCRIINHYQGLRLIKQASEANGWNIDLKVLLKIWSGGCIIRSVLLSIFRNEWVDEQSDILEQPYTRNLINSNLLNIKKSISGLATSNLAYPVTSSCLEYFKSLISSRSNAYIIQAQRDYFGAHTYLRLDDDTGGSHHTKWI